MLEIVVTDEFEAWYEALSEADAMRVTHGVAMLESLGVDQPRVRSVPVHPLLQGGRLARLDATALARYELSIADGGFHVLFALDPGGDAVLLYGYSDDENVSSTPAVAHVLLAAKVYFRYRALQEEAG